VLHREEGRGGGGQPLVGTREEWEDQVFADADHFRVHRFSPERSSIEVKDYREAMTVAHAEKSLGYRVLVYCVSRQGRSFAIPESRWEHYAKLFLEREKGLQSK
jgi:hypothetical protein